MGYWNFDVNVNHNHNNCNDNLLENGIVDAYIDFRQSKDWAMFRQSVGLPDSSGTFIELQSLKSSKRLMQGCYYKLNLELLKGFQLRRNETSLLLGGSYDLANMQMPEDDGSELLQQHEPLEPEDMSRRNVPREMPAFISSSNDMSLFVKDVNQANWVAPHHGGDYGASFRHYSLPCNDIAISVGANNSNGHPQKDMLRYLRSLGSVKRTDVDGDIEVRL